jgi:hypothetical protein
VKLNSKNDHHYLLKIAQHINQTALVMVGHEKVKDSQWSDRQK